MLNIKAVVQSVSADVVDTKLSVTFVVPTSLTPFTGGGAVGGGVSVNWTEYSSLAALRSAILQAICDQINDAPLLGDFTLHPHEILFPEFRLG